jgi:DTW domain-containing protein YfiP
VILIHPKEFKKEKNGTGLFTHLQLKNSSLIMGVNFSQDKQVNKILNDSNIDSYILYPGTGSINLSQKNSKLTQNKKNRVIFIIDGTWPCAKKMLKLSTNLHSIPKISFDNTIRSQFLIKQQPYPACLSTIESVHHLLSLLNKKDIESVTLENFLLPFEKMVEFQIKCIKNPPQDSYRVTGPGVIGEKNHYKSPKARNLFFES